MDDGLTIFIDFLIISTATNRKATEMNLIVAEIKQKMIVSWWKSFTSGKKSSFPVWMPSLLGRWPSLPTRRHR